MEEKDAVEWLYKQAMLKSENNPNMGDMEKILAQVSSDVCCKALERMIGEAAGKETFLCSKCRGKLNLIDKRRKRTIKSFFGKVNLERAYGYCKKCGNNSFPADISLGLQEHAKTSPRIQEVCALTALRAPAGQAESDIRRLTGIDLCPSTIHREALRQGERALQLRNADALLTQTSEGIVELAGRANVPTKPFTLIIEIDAWNIRERDNWGKTKTLQKCGEDTKRWHWVYTGTVFRLDQRGENISGRPFISERGYVATRRGIEDFRHQLHAEALQRGMLNAEETLILADGAIWIWNIASDRFKHAKQRVDLYHVEEHLWKLAKQLHGKGSDEAKEWVRPYIQWLKKRKNGALDVIESLEEINPDIYTDDQQKHLEREINYFKTHENRMDYKTGKVAGEPVGSGAIESTCAQYQGRFKLTGQFWSLAGDEAFLALSTIHKNNRWDQLFPHDLH